MNHFRITGLPRSRTAWYSTLFTWGSSFCWHELQGDDPEGMEHLGVSDPALVFRWEMEETLFSPKWVVIDRGFNHALDSCQKCSPSITEEKLWSVKLELRRLMVAVRPLIVPFESGSVEMDIKRCYTIAEYLGIDIGPAARVRQLCDMNIQIHPPILQKRLASLMQKEAA